MTDIEFDVLDELYFVTSFDTLIRQLDLSELQLKQTLQVLLERGWIKCFTSVSEEVAGSKLDFEKEYKQYYYLATKAGLLAHNSK